MGSDELLKARYDETPYRDQVLHDLDLSRLLGLAQMFRLGPSERDHDEIRVLDLACASGQHVRQQAARYPGVRFTGVDFSKNEIDAGRKAIEESGAANVELVLSDLRKLEINPGEYDVILCHGVFSWVDDEVKERIFELCRFGLKRSGVAAIAYLTYPGWKQREAIRELLAFRVKEVDDPDQRVRESALLLKLLHAGYSAAGEDCHAKYLKSVVADMQGSAVNAFLHDELGSVHDPCYFVQFVEWAREWGMQYLAEVDLGTMALDGLPPNTAGLLQELAPDFLETQQLIDFMVNRSGRLSLIVRDDAAIDRALSADTLDGLEFTTNLLPVGDQSLAETGERNFTQLDGKTFSVEDPCSVALLGRMQADDSDPPTLDELKAATGEQGHKGRDTEQALLHLIARGFAIPRRTMARVR